MRVALVHDWLTGVGGSERVLAELHELFPDAPIFTAAFDPARTLPEFAGADVRTSFLQRSMLRAANYGPMIPLMPLAFGSFDTRGFVLLLVSSHTAAKGIRKRPGQVMVCYCHTPMRWAWDLSNFYLQHRAPTPFARLAVRAVLRGFRAWDRRSANKVDQFIANSENVRRRIQRYYRRDAAVIWPPVDTARFAVSPQVSEDFLLVSRLEDYKRVDIAVDAFTSLGWPLRVVGSGPQDTSLRTRAGSSITFLGALGDAELAREYSRARAVVFTADEDAGIVPLEAMASGRPVLALRAGGAIEVVVEGATGAFFDSPSPVELLAALHRFHPENYDPTVIRRHAQQFDRAHFRAALMRCIDGAMTGLGPTPALAR
ncbi:MAG TPA: glycosyltransferase [Streptosporangiaceae bacterium]